MGKRETELFYLMLSRVDELLGNSGNLQWEMREIERSMHQSDCLPEHLELRSESQSQFMHDLQYFLEDVEGSLSLPSELQIAESDSAPELINNLLP
jgi:hypothetical protein